MVLLTGYSDRWSARPGEDLRFHVHCASGEYDTRLVRLLHGDENPHGPGFKEVELDSIPIGRYAGATRPIRKGSYGLVEPGNAFGGIDSVTLSAWVCPTLPDAGPQGILGWWCPTAQSGLGLFLGPGGIVELRAGTETLRAAVTVNQWRWSFVAAVIDSAARVVRLIVRPLTWAPGQDSAGSAEMHVEVNRLAMPGRPLLFAAGWLDETANGPTPRAVLNGKIARPALYNRALTLTECLAVRDGGDAGGLVAAWDFAADSTTTMLRDRGPRGLHGRTVNRPARAMTGPGWPGSSTQNGAAPQTHDAIHFHDDDVADVGWPVSHHFPVPLDMPSGIYALRLRCKGAEDYLPFFVSPPRGQISARLAVLMPTFSYLAYANESLDVSGITQLSPRQNMTIRPDIYRYIAENGLKSTYDLHSDGSGICYGSRRRPILDFRPKARCRTFDAPHQFAADLHLIDWLTEKGIAFDVITDELLHAEGVALLAGYRAVATGSHPEYWSASMLDARDAYLAGGGRLMYLGGNGFYWVTGVAEDEPDLIEIRRYGGTRTWQGQPGEQTISFSGETGGLWRERGRGAHRTVGVGFAGQGFDRGVPYRRSAESFRPEWRWVFAGVDTEIIGAGPSLVLGHGAAGFEVDRASPERGTPDHAVVLASSLRFTDAYQFATEEVLSPNPWTGGASAPELRADIVFLACPKGGAVFSTGSITWCATLSGSGYDSDTSRITENVLCAFLAEQLPTVG